MRVAVGPFRRIVRGIALIGLALAPAGCGDSQPKQAPAATDPDAGKRRREMEDFMKKKAQGSNRPAPVADRAHWG